MARTTAVSPAAFRGFADAQGDFFLALALHNDRDWFGAHRAEYEAGWAAPMAALLDEVQRGLRGAYGKRALGAPKVFRLHRDVRFSKDKSPYKTHVAGWIPLDVGGTPDPGATPAAFYLQVGVEERFTGSGSWILSGDALKRYRAAVLDPKRGAVLVRRLAALNADGFRVSAGATLARAPAGVDPAHPRAELLRLKGLVVDPGEVPARLLTRPALVPWLVERARAAAPLVSWLADHVA
ncbi:MAG: DUF2461 domain-containing protein [Anaeromyxobacter sp.]|nr:DUF2461 domain-containing protein [Anaeromyxobacter sp.]MBL0278584.1 DUF2461 domain-containing protein [Anaeromyxobacter sp.]